MILLTIIDDPKDKTKFCILYEKYRYLLHKVAMDILHDRNSEIAKACGIKEATVRQRIARGKVLIENEIRSLEANMHEADRGD